MHPTTSDELINLLPQDGLGEGLPGITEILMNAAILVERAKHTGAAPHERVEVRNGYANGFNPRTFRTSTGALGLAMPRVRESDSPFRTAPFERSPTSSPTPPTTRCGSTATSGTAPPSSPSGSAGTTANASSSAFPAPSPRQRCIWRNTRENQEARRLLQRSGQGCPSHFETKNRRPL